MIQIGVSYFALIWPHHFERDLNLAVKKGARSIAVWGMRGNPSRGGVSENPKLVWDVVGKTFGKLRSK